MDMKLRQYELGKRFCDGVVELGGIAGLNRVWEAPDRLPTLAELDAPGRVAGARRARGRRPATRPPVGTGSARRSKRRGRRSVHTAGTGRTHVPDVTKSGGVYGLFTWLLQARVTRR